MINEVSKDLKQVAAYLDDVIVFDSDPIVHAQTIHTLFERRRKHNLKLSPLEGAIGCHRCKLPGSLRFPGGSTPERRESDRIDQYADAHGCEAGPCTDWWYRLLPHFFPPTCPRGSVRLTRVSGRGLSLRSRPMWKIWYEKSSRSSRLRRFWFRQLGHCRRRLASVPRVLSRLHRWVWCRPRTGAGGRLHETHRVQQPSYARLGGALDSS